jgi:hypothetical protein
MSATRSRDLTRHLPGGNGGGKRSPDIDTFWRFTWPDGCFFTFKISTETVAYNEKTDPEEVADFVGRKVLRIKNASKSEFDDHFAGDQYPLKDPVYGIWDLAVAVNEDADGTADAVFMDEWWQALKSKACESTSGTAMKYIVASAMIIDHFLPDVKRCPAKQSAFCDALLWNPSDPHPKLPIDHVVPRRAFAPIYDAIADKPPPIPRPGTRDPARTEWIKSYGKKLDENRIEALTELLYAGAWRIRYFHKTGGHFPDLPGPRQGRGGACMSFDKYIEKECESCAYGLLKEWKGFASGNNSSTGCSPALQDYYSDIAFGMWFRSTKCIQSTDPVIDPDTKRAVFSYHPLHLAVFYIDVLEARNIAMMAWLPVSGTHVTDQVHGVGKAPTVAAAGAPPAALKRSVSTPAAGRSSGS